MSNRLKLKEIQKLFQRLVRDISLIVLNQMKTKNVLESVNQNALKMNNNLIQKIIKNKLRNDLI